MISIVLPAYDAGPRLDRALASATAQTCADFEVLAVDDGSTDDTAARLRRWAATDPRVRVLTSPENRGPAAARNLGCAAARGKWPAFLDSDDELRPDYLEQVHRHRDRADVLIFSYDTVADDGPAAGPRACEPWDPGPFREWFFAKNLMNPLIVAHRRELWERVGGFGEDVWYQEDWDYWKRLARAGASFLYLPIRSGIYHLRANSLTARPRVTPWQRRRIEGRVRVGLPPYGPPGPLDRRENHSVLLASPHADIGPPGPATAAAELLGALARAGFSCRALATTGPESGPPGTMADSRWGDVPVVRARLAGPRVGSVEESDRGLVFAAYGTLLDDHRPDVVLATFRDLDDPLARIVIDLAKQRDLPVALLLDDAAPPDPWACRRFDACLVTSERVRESLWETTGLISSVIPPVVDRDRARPVASDRAWLTVVPPRSPGDRAALTGIVAELARRRPDIPVRVLAGDELDPGDLPGVEVIAAAEARKVLASTRLLLDPATSPIAAGFAAAEALAAGIPVVASDRGALPELVADAGLLAPLPARCSPGAGVVPDPAEVEPFLAAIARLWDDPEVYGRACDRALRAAERWHPDRVAPVAAAFFGPLYPQPGPPFLPREGPGRQVRAGSASAGAGA